MEFQITERRNSFAPPASILIVEHEEILAENLKIFLARRASEVKVVKNEKQAFALLKTFMPDVLLVDIDLLERSCLEIYANLNKNYAFHSIFIIITSCDLSNDNVEKAAFFGFKHLLCKPFKFNDLQHMIDDCRLEDALA